MTNELLEQWRKEAEGLYPMSSHSLPVIINGKRNGYIEGCKATHESMGKDAERLKLILLQVLCKHDNLFYQNLMLSNYNISNVEERYDVTHATQTKVNQSKIWTF